MNKAYIVAVDMGYGHQRAAFPLEYIATLPAGWTNEHSPIISANNYYGIPEVDKRKWDQTQKTYEWFSRMRGLPIIGKLIFGIMDYFQKIEDFYPKRDLSKPTIQVRQIFKMIKGGLGRHLIDTLNEKPLPLLSTFFIPALFAEEHGYKGEIYCLCTDTDISRAWVPLYPEKSRIIYLAPDMRVKDRLIEYGIKKENIVLTGFPLPLNCLGDENDFSIAKKALNRRIRKLDPKGYYVSKNSAIISEYLGALENIDNKTVSLTFAIGGAGAQSEIGFSILSSLKKCIDYNLVSLNLVVGTSKTLLEKYKNFIESDAKLLDLYNEGKIKIIYRENKFEYFREFEKVLLETDVLWTKPSELSFYTGLGLPIIIAPPLGSQEDFNREWLYRIEAGIDQGNPVFTAGWFIDWLNEGKFAELAMDGFVNAPKHGTYNIGVLLEEGKIRELDSKYSI